MASITINEVPRQVPTSTNITGDEKLVSIDINGKPSVISINQILDKVDDSLADRVEDQVVDQIMDTVDDKIEDRIDEAIDNASNLKWTNVDGQN
jgi:hypothetical protein